MKRTVIVGGGIAGLTAGYELTKRGGEALIIEKEDLVGGLARSFTYGDFTFDIGPHRFYSDNEDIHAFIRDVLQDDVHTIRRSSGVYFEGKYYPWPLRRSALLKLPPKIIVRSLFDLIGRSGPDHILTFKDYIIKHLGPTIYHAFIKDYTHKFTLFPPEEAHFTWAMRGMEKAIIDKRIEQASLSDIVRSLLTPGRPPRTDFLYPTDGIGAFCRKLAGRFTGNGGTIITGDCVVAIQYAKDRIESVTTAGNGEIAVDDLVWTAPLPAACSLAGVPSDGLRYISTLLYNIEVSRLPEKRYQWCYFGSKDIVFNRASLPSLFSGAMVPAGGGDSICVEVTCNENDTRWNDPERLVPDVRRDLVKVGLLEKTDDVRAVHVEKIAHTYPCYTIEYPAALAAAKAGLSRFENFYLGGRTGLYWYNNMDESIMNGREIAGRIAEKRPAPRR